MTTSIIFPAFVNDYSGNEAQAISAFENNFTRFIAQASNILKLDLTDFDFQENNFLKDELKSQCISYIFSCSVADILRYQNIGPSFVSGYSMGIYAALYYCRSVAFNEGLLLVKNAWDIISKVTTKGNYGMGMVIGLDEPDMLKFLHYEKEAEICNQNNRHTFIITGSLGAVERVIKSAKDEGALRANLLPVSKPYHSQYLEEAAPKFTRIINKVSFKAPTCKYISAIDQQIIETAGDLKTEVINNLFSRMHWLNTMAYMVTLGTDLFFECGAGDSLTRNARFIEGDFKSFSVNQLDKFIEATQK